MTENLCFIHVKTKPTIALIYKASKIMSAAFTLETENELKSRNASIKKKSVLFKKLGKSMDFKTFRFPVCFAYL